MVFPGPSQASARLASNCRPIRATTSKNTTGTRASLTRLITAHLETKLALRSLRAKARPQSKARISTIRTVILAITHLPIYDHRAST